jgi:hypothetical protein
MPLISAIIGAAGTAVGSVAAAAGSFFTAAGFLGTIGRAALSLGLSMGLSALARSGQRKKAQVQQPAAVSNTLQVGGDLPRQVAFGRVGSKGHMINAWTSGPSNAYLTQIFALSDGRIGGLTGLWVGDKKLTLRSLSTTHGEHQRFDTAERVSPSLEIRLWDGRPGQSGVVSYLNSISVSHNLDGGSRGAGVAFVVVTLFNENSSWSGTPDLTFEFDGYLCYDPRKDSSIGGSGAHRWATPSTWEATTNPAIHLYNYLRGIQSEGQVFMGLEVADYDLLTDTFVSAANVCDETVTLAVSGSEKRYQASLIVTAEETEHRTAIQPIVQAMAGYLIEKVGQFGVIPGATQTPVDTLTDDDIVRGKGVKWTASLTRTERTNEVHGQFVDPSNGWQANSYPAIKSASALSEDGERLAVQLDFAAVTSSTQAQRIARARLRETRRQASATIVVGMHKLWYEIGDWITWNSALYGSRTYRIVGWARQFDDTTQIELREVGSEIYSWSTTDEQPINPPFGGGTPNVGISTVQNFVVQPDVAPGTGRSVIKMTWNAITDDRIKAVIIEYRPVGSVLATRVRDDSPLDGIFILDQPPTGATYEFRATIATEPPRPVTWTSWTSILISSGDVTIPSLSVDVKAAHADLWAFVEQNAEGLNLLGSVSTESIAANRTKIINLTSRLGSAEASILSVATTAATNTFALASLTTTINARFTPGKTANVDTVLEAFAKADFVAARNATGTSIQSGLLLGTGQLEIQSASDGTTADSLIKMLVRAGQTGALTEAGMTIRAVANANGSAGEIEFTSDKVTFKPSSTSGARFEFNVKEEYLRIYNASNVLIIELGKLS